jgi:hypothetical protein
MRKTVLLSTFAIACIPALLTAQQPARKSVASPEQLQSRESYRPRFEQQVMSYNDEHPLLARPIAPTIPTVLPVGKVSAVNPVGLGTASNALTCLRGEQNQVAVDNLTDAVVFIHRQDITIWGGASTDNGKYRYDVSIDGGTTFNNDIGALQSVYTNYGRYPNIAFFNPTATSNPLSEKIVWQGPTNRFPTPGWIGQVNGLSDVVTSSAPATTEHYQFDGQNVLLPGGLCQGLPGEFWSVEFSFDGTNLMDSIRLLKGTHNTGTSDIDWELYSLIDPGYDKTFDGSIAAVGPNIAFSPDGMTGYIGIVANVLAGTNTNNETLLPVFWKTTDGGVTWGNAMEVDLDAIPWIADSLQTLWVDSLGNPASDGRATAAFDYDMVVDSRGNVHMGVVIGTAAGGFAISSGIAKFLADITTFDGGATWDVTYLSPVLTFRGTYGAGSAPIDIDNFVQVARDDIGDHIFFSWVDSDTSQFTGSMNGIGFGESSNLAPNLRAMAKDVTNNTQTYPVLVTDGDLIWEGRALNPAMAEIVSMNGSVAELPVVVLEFLQNDPNLPSKFWYFGKDVSFDLNNPSIWCDQPQMQLGWTSFTTPGVTPVCAVGNTTPDGNGDVVLYDWSPNPTAGEAKIGFDLPGTMEVTLQVMNIYGQQVATLIDGELRAGNHIVSLETSALAAGVYFCQLTAGDKTYSKKLVVTK